MTTTQQPDLVVTAYEVQAPGGDTRLGVRLNWLRAGVLGANDGIVSTAGLVMGVAGAQASATTLLVAGLAGLVAGALSMAGGEYVSVSSQRDTEGAAVEAERRKLATDPAKEFGVLVGVYRGKGLSASTAEAVAGELTARDPLGAHTEAKLGIAAEGRTSAWQAALASLAAFTVGAVIPLLAMVLSPTQVRVWATVGAVSAALLLTGFVSARLGGSAPARAMVRNLVVGSMAMGLTYLVGHLVATG